MTYPIYRLILKIEHEYGPETYSISQMFREEPTEDDLENALQEFFNEGVQGRDFITVITSVDKEGKEEFERILPSDLTIYVTSTEIEYTGHDEWCLTWFSHYTFDTGQTDQEALDSFNEFVYRYTNGTKQTQSTLMGAEDRWRWKGMSYPDGTNAAGVETDPPCRCQYCKEQGVIRIGH